MKQKTFLNNPMIVKLGTREAFASEVEKWIKKAKESGFDGLTIMQDNEILFEIRL